MSPNAANVDANDVFLVEYNESSGQLRVTKSLDPAVRIGWQGQLTTGPQPKREGTRPCNDHCPPLVAQDYISIPASSTNTLHRHRTRSVLWMPDGNGGRAVELPPFDGYRHLWSPYLSPIVRAVIPLYEMQTRPWAHLTCGS